MKPWSLYTRWTPERDARLRQLYPAVGATEAARQLGATRAAVRSRVIALGIRGDYKRPRFWTADKDAVLRARYKFGAVKALAAELGCSASAIKQRARKLGLSSGRSYSREEVATVGRLWGTSTALEIAELLYGDPERWKRVWCIAARYLGLRKWPSWPAEVIERFRRLHAEGLCDRVIAKRMADVVHRGDRGRDQIKQLRQRFGLELNKDHEHRRRGVRRHLRTLGLDNPADLRSRAHRQYAERYGLPADLAVRQVQILLTLTSGPMALPEIQEHCGIKSMMLNRRKVNGVPVPGKTGTYISNLVERGLICWVATGHIRGGRRRYMLTAQAMDILAAAGKEAS